jgi:GNAT superfamily N-acetyltransferase
VPPTLAELAEDTLAYVHSSPMFEPVRATGCVHVFGRDILWVIRIRHVDLEAARAAARARDASRLEWWVGPSSPPGAVEELVAAGLVPDEVPVLTGMTCTARPPAVDGVDVRPAGAAEAAEIENAVWGGEPRPVPAEHPSIHLFAAVVDGRPVGVARSVDMDHGVAMMGGAVLPEFRGRGAYRALVRARWDYAAARGTPLLVVQAGALSAPVLDGLGFVRHCDLHLYVDPAVASRHGDD